MVDLKKNFSFYTEKFATKPTGENVVNTEGNQVNTEDNADTYRMA